MYYAGSRLNVYSYFLVSMAITLPFAAISWYLIEKPFLRLKRKPASIGHQVSVSSLTFVTIATTAYTYPWERAAKQ